MATENRTTTSAADFPAGWGIPHADTLKTVAHAQSNALHDVAALLNAMQSGLEALGSNEDIDHLFRLAHMAKVKVANSISEFNAHI